VVGRGRWIVVMRREIVRRMMGIIMMWMKKRNWYNTVMAMSQSHRMHLGYHLKKR